MWHPELEGFGGRKRENIKKLGKSGKCEYISCLEERGHICEQEAIRLQRCSIATLQRNLDPGVGRRGRFQL
jgi:hypothetical protein